MADGFCECGCGERTNVAPKNDTNHGWVKGVPLRFIHGHNRRVLSSPSASFVPVEPFQQAFQKLEPWVSEHPWQRLRAKDAANTVAVRLGWFTSDGRPDGSRVRRVLGLRPYTNGRGYPPRIRDYVRAPMAAQLCEALGVSPHEVGR
jgi:hypothetical protein